MLTDINADHLAVVAAEMGQAGCAVATRVLDVTEPEAWVRLFPHVEASMGPVQILVNAADFDPGYAVVGMSAGDWAHTVAINLSGVVYGLAALAPRIQGRPLPVSIMTTAGQRAEDGGHGPSYVARRAALAIADRWAGELAADGVRVVASHIPRPRTRAPCPPWSAARFTPLTGDEPPRARMRRRRPTHDSPRTETRFVLHKPSGSPGERTCRLAHPPGLATPSGGS